MISWAITCRKDDQSVNQQALQFAPIQIDSLKFNGNFRR
jgi:hypothetical protein